MAPAVQRNLIGTSPGQHVAEPQRNATAGWTSADQPRFDPETCAESRPRTEVPWRNHGPQRNLCVTKPEEVRAKQANNPMNLENHGGHQAAKSFLENGEWRIGGAQQTGRGLPPVHGRRRRHEGRLMKLGSIWCRKEPQRKPCWFGVARNLSGSLTGLVSHRATSRRSAGTAQPR